MSREHLVRPRWVWGGLVLVLVGAGLFALWTATWHAGVGIAGVVLFLLGAAAAWRGGILYDTHGGRAMTQELDDVRDEHLHRGTAPGDMVTDERLREEARQTTRLTEGLIRATETAPRPAFDLLGAGLLLAAAVFLVAMQGVYPHSQTGQDNALRSLLLAVVIALAALRLLLGQRPGPAPSAIAALCGVALIVGAIVADHDRQATVVLEIVIGAWVLVMSLVSLDHPAHEPAPVRRAERDDDRVHTRPRRPGRRADDVRIAAVALAISSALLGLAHLVRRLTGHARHP